MSPTGFWSRALWCLKVAYHMRPESSERVDAGFLLGSYHRDTVEFHSLKLDRKVFAGFVPHSGPYYL